jgi:hypothetical protein
LISSLTSSKNNTLEQKVVATDRSKSIRASSRSKKKEQAIGTSGNYDKKNKCWEQEV